MTTLTVRPSARGIRRAYGPLTTNGVTMLAIGVVQALLGSWLGWVFLGIAALYAAVILTVSTRMRVVIDDEAITLRDGVTAEIAARDEMQRVLVIERVQVRDRGEPLLLVLGKLDRRLLRLGGPLWEREDLDQVAAALGGSAEIVHEPPATAADLRARYPRLRYTLAASPGVSRALVIVGYVIAALAVAGAIAIAILRMVGLL